MTVVPTSKPTIRPPRQRRSQDALERVLKAGAELLREEGYEGFTVQEVSRRADVSVGSLYSRITSKDALLLAVYDRELGRINAATVQRITSGDLDELEGRELVTALVEKLAGAMLDNAEMLRVFMQRSTVDPVIWARGSARARQVATAFETILAGHRDKLGHPDPDLAVDIAFRFVFAAISRRISHGESFESSTRLPADVFVRELAEAAAGYLIPRR